MDNTEIFLPAKGKKGDGLASSCKTVIHYSVSGDCYSVVWSGPSGC